MFNFFKSKPKSPTVEDQLADAIFERITNANSDAVITSANGFYGSGAAWRFDNIIVQLLPDWDQPYYVTVHKVEDNKSLHRVELKSAGNKLADRLAPIYEKWIAEKRLAEKQYAAQSKIKLLESLKSSLG